MQTLSPSYSAPSSASSSASTLQPPVTPSKNPLRRIASLTNTALAREQPLADVSDPQTLLKDTVVPEVANSLHSSVNRALLGIASVTYHAIDRHKGIYLETKLYQGEPSLGDQVLKRDTWPGIHALATASPFTGVVNFRQVPLPGNVNVGLNTSALALSGPENKSVEPALRDSSSVPSTATPIQGTSVERVNYSFDLFGLGQPSMEGLHAVVQYLLTKKRYLHVIWINLREEPVVYINGNPFAPRDKETLNINLDYLLGIESLDLEAMEGRLKADVFAVAREGEGRFSFYTQTASMDNEVAELNITTGGESLRTLREIYNSMKYDHQYNVDYYRIPITDECAPEEKDFDDIVHVLKDCNPNTAVVFNCQMGRGRTTTGLVCAYLISQMSTGDWQPKAVTEIDSNKPNLERAEFQVILKLISTIPDGELVKAQVDEAIDVCSALQNLRTCILECKKKVDEMDDKDKKKKEREREKGRNFLERYFWLLNFNAYLRKHAPKYSESFSEWMKSKWKTRKLLRNIELV